MKIERPGKACAVTPTSGIDGPLVLLEDGTFTMVHDEVSWNALSDQISVIWDAGEILIGFGEFLENNKELVPSSPILIGGPVSLPPKSICQKSWIHSLRY